MIWDKLPIDEGLKPFLPAALSYLGIPVQTADQMEYIYDFIMRLKNNGEVKSIGELLQNPDILSLIQRFKSQPISDNGAESEVIDVEAISEKVEVKDSSRIVSNKVRVVKCKHCGMYNYATP